MLHGVSFGKAGNIQPTQDSQSAKKTDLSKKANVAIGLGTVLAGAAACAGIIYGVKSGKINKQIDKLKTRTNVFNNLIENNNAKIARATHVNQPNITAATRGIEAVKKYNFTKETVKLEKLGKHIQEAHTKGDTKALNGMLKQFNKLLGTEFTLEEMLVMSTK